MKELRGIVVPFATPFTSDEEMDVEKAKQLIDMLIEARVHGLIILGDTGEFFMLTMEERLRFAEAAFEYIDGRVPVVIQPSAISTREAVAYARHAEELGADGLLLLPPYYRCATEDETYAHYAAVAEAVDVPIICYCLPLAGAHVMTPEFLGRLSEINSIRYVKDSTGILSRIRQIRAACGDRLEVFVGGDTITYDGLAAGAVGSIWGCANFMPREAVSLFELVCEKGDLAAAGRLWDGMFPVCDFVENSPYAPAVKAALGLVGLDVGPPRRPALPLSGAERAELARRMRGLGLPVVE